MTAGRHNGPDRGADDNVLDALPQAPDDPWASRFVGGAFLVAAGAGLALAGAFALGGSTPLQGVLLFVTLGALGSGVVVWAHRLLPRQEYVEQRHPLASDPEAARLVAATVVAERGLSRRSTLRWLLLAGLGGTAAALAAPLLSLGSPGGERPGTTWRRGARLVDATGGLVTADTIPVGGFRTVFPEGTEPTVQAQTVLVRVEPDLLRLSGQHADWAPQGFVAYSKLCTHAGCPVGLYRAEAHVLVCPCHQSSFAVLDGAVPVFGPAARPLPQLPITLRPDGTFAALDDFLEPVGPSYWNITWADGGDQG